MKAWCVFAGEPSDGSLLVFASSAAKARHRGYAYNLWDFGSFIETRARRAPQFDTYSDQCRSDVIETNEDLPDHAPRFYSELET